MSRHPYTFAADYVRHYAGYAEDGSGTVLSRSQASQIIGGIAEALGLDKEHLAVALSKAYQDRSEEISEHDAKAFLATMIEP